MPTEIAGVDDAPAAEHDENNAEARLQALNDCVETISHEIRTPLSSILLNADRIQRTTEETTSSDSAIRIKRGVQRISEIVTRILLSAQIEQFGIVLRVEKMDLVVVVLESVDRLREEALKAGCVVSVNCPLPIIAMWDRDRIDQIVTNLLTNAFKYGSGKPVHVQVAIEEGCACIEVWDEGCGIPSEARKRVFDRYTRLDKRDLGFGLGLWIVKQVVDAFHGEVAVLDDPLGTKFRVRLPLSAK